MRFDEVFGSSRPSSRHTLTQNLNINGEKVSLLFAISNLFTACMKTLCRRHETNLNSGAIATMLRAKRFLQR